MTETDESFFDFDMVGLFIIIVFIGCLFGFAGYSAYAMG